MYCSDDNKVKPLELHVKLQDFHINTYKHQTILSYNTCIRKHKTATTSNACAQHHILSPLYIHIVT